MRNRTRGESRRERAKKKGKKRINSGGAATCDGRPPPPFVAGIPSNHPSPSEKKMREKRVYLSREKIERERKEKMRDFFAHSPYIAVQKPDPVTRTEPAQDQFPWPNARPFYFSSFYFLHTP